MSTASPITELGWKAVDFRLTDTRGKVWTPATLRGPKGLVLAFICNHCPYVQAIVGKLVQEGRALYDLGFGVAAICSNDAAAYPEDGYEAMGAFSRQHHLPFPYLHDVTQATARAYGAVCTPEFFGFNDALRLQYHGRLDDSGRIPKPAGRRELYEAMRQVADTGQGPREQVSAVGCSIKWKAA